MRDSPTLAHLTATLQEVFRLKTAEGLGWSPRIRQRFGYFTPDEWYEAVMSELIGSETDWLDVGCGHELFPSNMPLARILSSRCRLLVGVDSDSNIRRNELLHERVMCSIEGYNTDRQFDVVSLRMVAEHIQSPAAALAAVNRLTRVDGRVVVYTVSKWAPTALVAALTPMVIHRAVKQALWDTAADDSFPTVYRMNTRADLQKLFTSAGFIEERFLHLNDCRSFARWRLTSALELLMERGCRKFNVNYPEMCLLGMYRKTAGRPPPPPA